MTSILSLNLLVLVFLFSRPCFLFFRFFLSDPTASPTFSFVRRATAFVYELGKREEGVEACARVCTGVHVLSCARVRVRALSCTRVCVLAYVRPRVHFSRVPECVKNLNLFANR